MSEISPFNPEEDLIWSEGAGLAENPSVQTQESSVNPGGLSREEALARMQAANKAAAENRRTERPAQSSSRVEQAREPETPTPKSRFLRKIADFFRKPIDVAQRRLTGLLNELGFGSMTAEELDTLSATDLNQLDAKAVKNKAKLAEGLNNALQRKLANNISRSEDLREEISRGVSSWSEHSAEKTALKEEHLAIRSQIEKTKQLIERLKNRAQDLAGQTQAKTTEEAPVATERSDKKAGLFSWLNKLFSKKEGETLNTADVEPEQKDLLVEVGVINREGKPTLREERNDLLDRKAVIEERLENDLKRIATLREQREQALVNGNNGAVFTIDRELNPLIRKAELEKNLFAWFDNRLEGVSARAQQEKRAEASAKSEAPAAEQEDRKLAVDRVKDLLTGEDKQLSTPELNELWQELKNPDLDKDQRLHHLVVLYLYGRISLILGSINLKQSYGLLNEKGITISALNQVKKELHLEPVLTEEDKSSAAYKMGERLGKVVGSAGRPADRFLRNLPSNLETLFKKGRKPTESTEVELTPAQKELEKAADQAKVKLQAKGLWGLLINAPAMIEPLNSSVEKLAAIAIMIKDAQKQYTDEQQVELADAGFTNEVLDVLRKRYEAEDKARIEESKFQEIGGRLLGSLEAMNEKSKREKAKRAEKREAERQSKADYKEVKAQLKEARNKLKDLERKIADSKNLLIDLTGYDRTKEQANLDRLGVDRLDLLTQINGLETSFAQLQKEKKERDLSLRKDLILAIIGASMVEAGILLGSGPAQENLRNVLEYLRTLLEKNPNADVSQFRAMGDNISRFNPNAGKLFQTIADNIFSGARHLGQVAEQAQTQADKLEAARDFSKDMGQVVTDVARSVRNMAEQAGGIKEALASVKLPELNFADQFKNILANVNVPAGGNVWDKVVPEIRNIFGVSENMWRTASADQAQFIMDALRDLFPQLDKVSPGVHDFSNLLSNENVRQAFQRLFESKNAQEAQAIVDQLTELRRLGVF